VLSPSDTAYPLLKESPTERELQELFTPNLFELGFAAENSRQPIPRLGLLLLLKSFQKLGYFVRLAEIPPPIVLHVAKTVGWNQIPDGLSTYDASTARFRHMALVRSYLRFTSRNGLSTSLSAACAEGPFPEPGDDIFPAWRRREDPDLVDLGFLP
jgi:Domain of unknown function (DUF4158)